MKTYQHLQAENDENGNPQRLYLVYELIEPTPNEGDPSFYEATWRLIDVYDEGFGGRPKALRGTPEIPSVRISSEAYQTTYHVAEAAKLLRYS